MDYANTRATDNSTITSQNVAELGISWSYDIPGVGEWGASATNPLILDNTVYLQDLKSNVYAFDLATGNLKWKKEYDLDNYGPNGPAIGWDKIFVIKGRYEIAALDLQTGSELWTKKLSDIDSTGIDIQLTAYNNLVYASTVPGSSNSNFYTGGGVGIIYALDQETGDIKWEFNTVDSADIWGNSQVNSGGGAWFPPAIDVNTGIMYWGTGNPAPWPGTEAYPNGTSRPGDNLYTNTMLALDSATGELLWYKQVLPHDLFDLD
jgi:glucose dehydrogenase